MRFEQIITAVSARVAIADACTKLVHESNAVASRFHQWLRMSMPTSGYLLQASTGFARALSADLPGTSGSPDTSGSPVNTGHSRLFGNAEAFGVLATETPDLHRSRTNPTRTGPTGCDSSKRSCRGADGHKSDRLKQASRGRDGING